MFAVLNLAERSGARFSTACRKLCRGLIPQRTVGTDVVVLPFPFTPHTPGFPSRSKQLSVQKLIPKPTEERFRITVLPRSPGLYVQRSYTGCGKPSPNVLGNEFRSIVRSNVTRSSLGSKQLDQRINHLARSNAPSYLQSQTFPSVLVYDCQPLQRTPHCRPIVDKIPSPHVILVLRTIPRTAVFAAPQTALLSAFPWHFQAFSTPETIDPFRIHSPAFSP